MLDFDEFYELHQESLHCHHDVLDEENDGCHFWYCQKGIGASRSSQDSRWRRCNFVTASLKSDRDSSVHRVLMCWERSTNSTPPACIFLQFDQFRIASHEILSLSGSDREFLQNSFWCTSFLNYWQSKVFSLFFILFMTIAMRLPFLSDIVWDGENIQLPSVDTSAGLILSQELPASAVKDALMPVKKAFFALHFRNCLA